MILRKLKIGGLVTQSRNKTLLTHRQKSISFVIATANQSPKYANMSLEYLAAALFAVCAPLFCGSSSENSSGPNPFHKPDSLKSEDFPSGKYVDKPENFPNFPKALEAFKSCLRENQIETDESSLIARGKPWSSYHVVEGGRAHPNIIIYPESTSEVASIVKICNANNIPIIPFGGGTSLEGQTLTPERGVSLDLNNMNKIIKLNEEDMDVVVQPGLGYLALNELIRSKGLWFPLDPGPGASIGGMVSCRCSGSTAVKYGSMRENVLSLTVVTSDGSVVSTGGRARKSSAGYDLRSLMVGSEGTLGIVTEATLKLRKIPKYVGALRVSFRNGIKDAAVVAREIVNNNEGIINRCEFMDDTMISTIKMTEHVDLPSLDTLLLEIAGISESDLACKISLVKDLALGFGGSDVVVTTDPAQNAELWKVRKVALWSSMAAYPSKDIMITDICVPLSNLPTIIDAIKLRIKDSILPCPMVAHAGDGNIHVFIMFDPADAAEHAEADSLSDFMVVKALEMEGTCTGEHGLGYGKMKYLDKEYNEATVKMMADIKVCLDPKNILNPGKILDPKYIKASRESSNSCSSCKAKISRNFCG